MAKISNEVIIAALLQHGTIKEAAAAIGISPRTIHGKFSDCHFRAEYTREKAGILRTAAAALNCKLSDAIDTIAEIMADPNANPATRLQAAQTILNSAARFTERLTETEKQSIAEENDPAGWAAF